MQLPLALGEDDSEKFRPPRPWFQDFLIGSATDDTWVINRLLRRPPRCITPGGAHGQVISGGGRGPQPVLGEQPRAVELMDRSGDQGGISGASPGAPALAPGRGTPSYDLSLEALGSQHPVASPDQAEWPVQRAALEQESSGDETEKGAHCLEIRTETPGPSPPGRLSPHWLLWPHSASRRSFHQHDPTHDPSPPGWTEGEVAAAYFFLPRKSPGCSLIPTHPRALWPRPLRPREGAAACVCVSVCVRASVCVCACAVECREVGEEENRFENLLPRRDMT